jgi:hypothetical protein
VITSHSERAVHGLEREDVGQSIDGLTNGGGGLTGLIGTTSRSASTMAWKALMKQLVSTL